MGVDLASQRERARGYPLEDLLTVLPALLEQKLHQ